MGKELTYEDLTKEELIIFIKEYCIRPGGSRLQSPLIHVKYQAANKKAEHYEDVMLETMGQYIRLMEEMQGDIPYSKRSKIAKKMVDTQKARETAEAQANKYRTMADRYFAQWQKLCAAELREGS